jgi:glycosyltransferase involved in cell wall biosynthesis
MKFAFIMSEEVGLRTQFLNWKNNFPTDLNIEPHWIVVSFYKSGGWIESLPGVPAFIKTRLRAALEVRDGLRRGPFDATFIAVHSALATLPGYVEQNACFTTLDVTPKQLHDFGDFYGKYPSKIAALEAYKHRSRSRNYGSFRGLFPWSNWAAKSLIADYAVDKNRIHVIPPGVDTTQWKPTNELMPTNKVNLLFVGGDFDRKGGPLLLNWAGKSARQDWRLNIVTRHRLDISDSRITVHNDLSANDPRLTNLYQQSHVFVLPTLADCYSIAGIEALASGLPVILSLTGGTGDVIKDNQTGFLLHNPTAENLGAKLDILISNSGLRNSMSAAARRDAMDRYDVIKNIRKTVSIMIDSL